MCAVAGSWASRRPSLAPYGTGTGAAGATKGGDRCSRVLMFTILRPA